MSKEKLLYEAKRWLNTALEDFKAAEILLNNKMFSHSCFYFQQAGEKALKAIWYLEDEEPWGHSLLRLIEEAPQKEKYKFLKDLQSSAAFLDKFYIPTRYPSGLNSPFSSYFLSSACFNSSYTYSAHSPRICPL